MKNLALAGCKRIDLIDLDTIDVSNLNRQFLFRPEHVGHSKAIVAAKAAEQFNPDIKVTSYHDNIKSAQFNVSYFAQFDVVLNALDNLDARRHVNRLCLAAKVPLFDSGTTGYLGQVMPIIKGFTACYECYPKPSPKVYPICTIRSTPDKPVHCIVWAKEAFKLLFARPSDSMLFEDGESTGETSEYMHCITYPTNPSMDTLLAFAQELAIGLFHRETQKKIDMDVYKTATKLPTPIALDAVDSAVAEAKSLMQNSDWKTLRYQAKGWEQRVPSLHDCLVDFVLAVCEVGSSEETAQLIGQLSFDKDDDWAMRFVAATANIRSAIFSIPILSFHDGKGIAGNIIPAIATTNAIVAGAQVALALKFLVHFTRDEVLLSPPSGNDNPQREALLQRIRKVFPHAYCVRHPNRRGAYLQPSFPDSPVTSCYVCGASQLTLILDTTQTTLARLVDKVLKGKLGFNAPSISQGANILYEEGDDADEDLQDNLPLLLSACPGGGILDGAILEVSDFTQNLELTLLVQHRDQETFENSEDTAIAADLFILEGQEAHAQRKAAEEAAAAGTTAATAASSSSNATTAVPADDDDVFMILDENEAASEAAQRTTAAAAAAVASNKRPRDEAEVSTATATDTSLSKTTATVVDVDGHDSNVENGGNVERNAKRAKTS